MKNLRNLKDDEVFKRIGVTEEFTLSERKMIKEYNDKAKKKTEEDDERNLYIWRVRGTPQDGLQIKRIRRQVKDDHFKEDEKM